MAQSTHNGVSKVLIDHVVITVGDQLEATADRYQRLGFNLTERGHHTLGSSNYLAIFETDYLELLGFLPGRETSRADLWRDPPGLTGLVFKPGDPDARYADRRVECRLRNLSNSPGRSRSQTVSGKRSSACCGSRVDRSPTAALSSATIIHRSLSGGRNGSNTLTAPSASLS